MQLVYNRQINTDAVRLNNLSHCYFSHLNIKHPKQTKRRGSQGDRYIFRSVNSFPQHHHSRIIDRETSIEIRNITGGAGITRFCLTTVICGHLLEENDLGHCLGLGFMLGEECTNVLGRGDPLKMIKEPLK